MSGKTSTCFVISPIGSEGSDVRRRSDQILKHVIAPAAATCGFVAIRADQISEPGLITTQVIQHIIDDPLVIADLTGSNANVFYELAIRHAIRKPLVQIIQKDEKIPFDVAGMRTVPVDHRDLDSVQEAKSEIERQIKSTLSKKADEIESPISVSIELQALRQSDNPEERSIAQFVSSISELFTGISAIEKRLSNPEALFPLPYMENIIDHILRRSRRNELVFRDIAFQFDKILNGKDHNQPFLKEQNNEIAKLRDMFLFLESERDADFQDSRFRRK